MDWKTLVVELTLMPMGICGARMNQVSSKKAAASAPAPQWGRWLAATTHQTPPSANAIAKTYGMSRLATCINTNRGSMVNQPYPEKSR